jgi:hypothetical protein
LENNNTIWRAVHLHDARLSAVARTAALVARRQRLSLASTYLDMVEQTIMPAARERLYASAARPYKVSSNAIRRWCGFSAAFFVSASSSTKLLAESKEQERQSIPTESMRR